MDHIDIPDFSCEIDKPLSYLQYVLDHFSNLKNLNEHGELVLDSTTVDTFCWMLADAKSTVLDIQHALYPKEGR